MHPILLEVTFTLDPRDFRRASSLYSLKIFGKSLRSLGISSLVVLPVLVYIAAGRAAHAWPLYVLAGGLLLAMVGISALVFLTGRRAGRHAAGVGVPITWRFNEDGVQGFSDTAEESRTWDKMTGFVEIAEYFLLFPQPEIFNILPKRAFRTPDELSEMRRLLRSKFAGCKVQSGG